MNIRIVWQGLTDPSGRNTRLSIPLTEEQAKVFEEKLDSRGAKHKRVKKPSIKSLEKWMMDGICPTPDGCKVEPDGICPHGWDAWLKICGII